LQATFERSRVPALRAFLTRREDELVIPASKATGIFSDARRAGFCAPALARITAARITAARITAAARITGASRITAAARHSRIRGATRRTAMRRHGPLIP